MGLSRSLRRVTRPLRDAWDAVPPLPNLPPPRRIGRWWRHHRNYDVAFFPRLPSAADLRAWYKERQHLRLLPPLPSIPSPKEIAKRIRNRPPPEWRTSLVPGVPTLADLADLL